MRRLSGVSSRDGIPNKTLRRPNLTTWGGAQMPPSFPNMGAQSKMKKVKVFTLKGESALITPSLTRK